MIYSNEASAVEQLIDIVRPRPLALLVFSTYFLGPRIEPYNEIVRRVADIEIVRIGEFCVIHNDLSKFSWILLRDVSEDGVVARLVETLLDETMRDVDQQEGPQALIQFGRGE